MQHYVAKVAMFALGNLCEWPHMNIQDTASIVVMVLLVIRCLAAVLFCG